MVCLSMSSEFDEITTFSDRDGDIKDLFDFFANISLLFLRGAIGKTIDKDSDIVGVDVFRYGLHHGMSQRHGGKRRRRDEDPKVHPLCLSPCLCSAAVLRLGRSVLSCGPPIR